MELSSFEDKTIKFFIQNGLDKNINKEGNISFIITTNKNKTKLESYDFSYKDEKKNIYYDIPYFHNNVPEGFSVFCTDEELESVLRYVNKRDSKTKVKEKKKEELITSEPEPSKKNFICQLCRSRFDNYKQHIISDIHFKNMRKHQNSYNKLSLTFKRIVNNNFNISKENSGIKSFSNQTSIDLNSINDLFEFSPQDFKKLNNYQSYNLRIKKSPSFCKEDNYYNYFMCSSRNNAIKIIRNENDFSSPQQQVSSTASSTCKNILTLFDEVSDKNFTSIKKNKRRREDDEDDLIYEQMNMKNKRIKIN